MRRSLKSEDRIPKTERRPKTETRTASWPRGSFRVSSLGSWASVLPFLWLLAIGDGLSAAPAPFLHLRDAALTYPGPSEDFTNLTEIRLGWFGPTNLDDPLTGDQWWAANRAVQEANAQNAERGTRNLGPRTSEPGDQTSDLGLRTSDFARLPVRLVPRWSINPWGTGVSQLTRMVYDEQPLALIGSVDSASTHLAEQVVAKAQLPLVSPIATDKSVTLAGVSWMFSCAPSDDAIARVLVDEIFAALAAMSTDESATRIPQSATAGSLPASASTVGSAFRVPNPEFPRRLALLTCTDHESRMTTREVLREFSRRGRMPDFRFDVPPGVADFTRQMESLVEAKPAIVLVVAGADDSARWVKTVRGKVPSARVFGSQTVGRARFRELAGPAAEGVCFPLLFTADAGDSRYSRFASRFRAERGETPDYTAVLTYDTTCLLIEAIRQAGPNRARIRGALIGFSPWPGLAGPIHFDGTGQNTGTSIRMGTIQDGRIVSLPRGWCPNTATTDRTARL